MRHQVDIRQKYILIGVFVVSNTGLKLKLIISQSNNPDELITIGKAIYAGDGIKKLAVVDTDFVRVIWHTEPTPGYFKAGMYISSDYFLLPEWVNSE